jgi:hypothetical protein
MTPRLATLSCTLGLSIGIAAFAFSPASAQTFAPGSAPASPTSGAPVLARALQGKNVWISADGARVRGRVTSLDPTGLVLVEDGVATTIPYKNIVRVEKSTHRLRNGALIGLVSGAGFGLVMGGLWCGGDEYCEPGTVPLITAYYAGLGAAAGVGIGAIVHAARKNGDVLYDARHSTTTMSLAPILSPGRKGAAFTMTWR